MSEYDESREEPRGEADEGRGALVARLRQRRQQIGDLSVYEDMDVPGYDGDLFIRVVPLPGGFDQMKKLGLKVDRSRNPRKELYAAADTIVKATQGIYVRQENGAEETLDGSEDAPTFAEPHRIAGVLGFRAMDSRNKPITPRAAVLAMFNNDLAVMKFYVDLSDWLQDRHQSDDEEFVGESSGSVRSS